MVETSADSDNSPVEGMENVINSATDGLITVTNRSSPGVERNKLSPVDNQANVIDLISIRKEQKGEKTWNELCDQHSSDRSFKTGDKVLVLLPTSTDKLTCKWQGPGDILRRVNDVTYEVNINRRISKLHVNLLRAWHERESIPNLPQVNVTMIADPYQEGYELLPGLDDDDVDENGPEIGCCLSIQQRADISQLISNYADVFSETTWQD